MSAGTAATVPPRPPWREGPERRWEERVLRAAHPVAYPLLSRARRPAFRLPGVGVVVTSTDLVREVLSDSAGFAKNGPGTSADFWTPVLGPRVLLNMHGPEHEELRRRLSPVFAPRAVRELLQRTLTPEVDALTRALHQGDPVDLVPVAQRCAGRAISALVGLPAGVVGTELAGQVSTVTGLVRLRRGSFGPAQVRQAREGLAGVLEPARRAYRRGEEGTVPGRMRALGLSEEETVGAVAAFVVTGTETVVAHLPRAAAILHDTGWWPRVGEDTLDAVVGETLRVTTPSLVTLRRATGPATLAGIPVARDERILVATFLATRPPGAFAPEAYRQSELRALWFGAGAHFCIGPPLATAQLRTLLGALATVPGLRVVDRRPQRRVLIPAYARLVVQGGSGRERSTGGEVSGSVTSSRTDG